LILSIINLLILGIAGGLFLIPFDTFVQVKSPAIKRGQVIAANSFLSFVGVLIASFFLWLLAKLSFTPSSGFAFMGVLTFCFSIFLISRTTDYFLPYFAKNVLSLFYPVRAATNIPQTPKVMIFKGKKTLVWWLFIFWPELRVIKVGKKGPSFFQNFYRIEKDKLSDKLKAMEEKEGPILLLGKELPSFPEIKFHKIKVEKKIFNWSFYRQGFTVTISPK
jgi:hypothetical protein